MNGEFANRVLYCRKKNCKIAARLIFHTDMHHSITQCTVTLLEHKNGKLRVKNSLKGVEVFGTVKQAAEHEVDDQVPHPYTPNDWSLDHDICWYVEFH